MLAEEWVGGAVYASYKITAFVMLMQPAVIGIRHYLKVVFGVVGLVEILMMDYESVWDLAIVIFS
jgi:hypothetical protein